MPAAWLLSSHRLDRQTAELAAWVREKELDLFADNGTLSLIGQVTDRFLEPLKPLAHDVRQLRRSLGKNRRIPAPSEIPDGLRRRAVEAAVQVTATVDELLDAHTTERLLNEQLSMNPTHLIAREDFATACLLALGLEREITGTNVGWFTRRNRITLDFWEQVASDDRCRHLDIYATLSAVDYNTARAAAREAARRNVDRIALGFAGINQDSSYCESYLAGRRRTLPAPAPRRYLRVAEIVCGVRDGYRDQHRRLRAFHALGLGATTMLPTLAAGLDWFTHISLDATSPLHDSVRDRVFYDPADWGERVNVIEGAERILTGGNWSFDCPFCRYIRRRFGHAPTRARSWWKTAGRPGVQELHLHPDQPLGKAIPLFATARGPITGTQTRARTAHNHWTLDHLSAQIPSSHRRDWALKKLEDLAGTRTLTARAGVKGTQVVIKSLGP